VKQTAREFEGMFLGQMLNEMWATVDIDPEFGGGNGEAMFRGMLIDEYGKNLMTKGGLGIAAQVEDEIRRLQKNLSA
jgi:Rod binding domain-containing protein